MSDKNLLIGDTTYPHDSRAAEWLRSKYGAHRGHYEWRALEEAFNAGLIFANEQTKSTIEQLELAVRHRDAVINELESQLNGAQKSHARYEYMRKLTPRLFNVFWVKNLHGYAPFDDLIDAAIKEVK